MRTTTLTSVAALALLTLLPSVGAWGRAHAGYARGAGEDAADWGQVVHGLIHGETAPASEPASVPVAPAPMTPSDPGKPGRGASPIQTGEAGTSGSSLPHGAAPAGLVSRVELPQTTRTELLFLAEGSLRPQASSSRLFRPPRA